MRYEGPIYRPPSEADSLLIQATVGCPHNKCTFCMVYKKGPPYRVRSVKDICEDIDKACEVHGSGVKTLFFPAGNTIAMPTADLSTICRYGKSRFPGLQRITVYGSSQYIARKGRFHLLSPHQVLAETRLLIEHLQCRTVLASDHYTNYLDLSGTLPEDKERLLGEIDRALKWPSDRFRPFFIGNQ